MKALNGYCVYLLECRDGTYYCGTTTDMVRRLNQHSEGRAARYTRGRTPVKIVAHTENGYSRQAALAIEHAIKKLPRHKKTAALIACMHGTEP
jgi:putative endonuclease